MNKFFLYLILYTSISFSAIAQEKNQDTTVVAAPKIPYPDYNFEKFFNKNFSYSSTTIKIEKQLIVWVEFLVTKEGKIENVKIIKRSGNEQVDNEVIRVFQLMPPWVPGEINGEKKAILRKQFVKISP